MSRRLDILSLLCEDEDAEPVVPASPTRPRPPTPLAHQLPLQPKPFLGLDALVHAATEERRRLSGSSSDADAPALTTPVPVSPLTSSPNAERYIPHDVALSPVPQPAHSYKSLSSVSPQTDRITSAPVDEFLNAPCLPRIHSVSHEESRLRLDHHPSSPPTSFPSSSLVKHAESFHRSDHSRTPHGLFQIPQSHLSHASRDFHIHGQGSPSLIPSNNEYPITALPSPVTPAISASENKAEAAHFPGIPVTRPASSQHPSSFRSSSLETEVTQRSRKRRRYTNSPSRNSKLPFHINGGKADTSQSSHNQIAASPTSNTVPLSDPIHKIEMQHLKISDACREHEQSCPTSAPAAIPQGDTSHSFTRDIETSPPASDSFTTARQGEKQHRSHDYLQLSSEKSPVVDDVGKDGMNPPLSLQVASTSTHARSSQRDTEDAHEWFLEHYDKELSIPPVRSPKPTFLKIYSPPKGSTPSHPTKESPKLTTMPEAAVALEQELDNLVLPMQPDPQDSDVEVDRAVTELVAETLEADDCKIGDTSMEADVIDELLSLVDDRPVNHRAIDPPKTKSHLSPSSYKDHSESLHPDEAANFLPRKSPNKTIAEHSSMPPPASTDSGTLKERRGEHTSSSDTKSKKTKDSSKQSVAKHKTVNAKSRVKSGSKLKVKTLDGATSPPSAEVRVSSGPKGKCSRSRSASAIPGRFVGSENDDTKIENQEQEEIFEGDDKLYCVCKTKYDEDRFMIACDKCDEWYHIHCVDVQELEIDLVDQFICPPCVENHPQLGLRTTYKARCLFGLEHVDPSSPDACHRPARGIFSKYCSDECGVRCMQSRLQEWSKKGGKKESLLETARYAQQREGVVRPAEDWNIAKPDDIDRSQRVHDNKTAKMDRGVQRLNRLLDSVVELREEVKNGLECVVWRKKLLKLATERAEQIGQCGWDQRLCFGDQEWEDFGSSVIESYEAADGDKVGSDESEGEWWCSGKKLCDRHAGWQTIRFRDVCNEVEKKEDALANLTTRERELRKRIADMLASHGRSLKDLPTKSSPILSTAKFNGRWKGKREADTKKGKKRKGLS